MYVLFICIGFIAVGSFGFSINRAYQHHGVRAISHPRYCFGRNSISPSITLLKSSVEDTSLVKIDDTAGFVSKVKTMARVGYKFSRPHTIKVNLFLFVSFASHMRLSKGTILASTMAVIRALIENPTKVSLKLVPRAVIGLVALLCGNAYIVGLNQIYDVKIDEVFQYHTNYHPIKVTWYFR